MQRPMSYPGRHTLPPPKSPRPASGIVSRSQRLACRALAVGLALALAACSSNISVPLKGDFPEPVVGALPLAMGIYYEDGFRTFKHQETDTRLSVDLGAPNVKLFDQIFSKMFARAVPVGTQQGQPGLDAVIEPMIETFEYLEPAISGSKFYAVTIRYRISVYGPDGGVIASWPLVAYGKSRSKTLNSGESLGEATLLAMRDAAAILSTEFKDQKQVKAWLLARNSQ